MTTILRLWRNAMDNMSDPRTKDWFLMDSPFPTLIASLSYIFIVKVLGPRMMKNRKAFDIRKIQFIYNLVHLVINAYLFQSIAKHAWFAGYSWRCQAADQSNYGTPLIIAKLCWWYFFSKFTDFFETFIFVLGKRSDLVNLYHVCHHSIMPFSIWWGVKFLPGGHATFFGCLNTFVHVVIYTYLVLITAFSPLKRYTGWWKTFLPLFQVAQFVAIVVHAFQLILKNECNFPMAFVYFIGGHGILFYCILMFELKNKRKKVHKQEDASVKPKIRDSKNFSTVQPIFSSACLDYDSLANVVISRKQKPL